MRSNSSKDSLLALASERLTQRVQSLRVRIQQEAEERRKRQRGLWGVLTSWFRG